MTRRGIIKIATIYWLLVLFYAIYINFYLSLQNPQKITIIPMLQIRKLKLKKAQQQSQGQKASEWHIWDLVTSPFDSQSHELSTMPNEVEVITVFTYYRTQRQY